MRMRVSQSKRYKKKAQCNLFVGSLTGQHQRSKLLWGTGDSFTSKAPSGNLPFWFVQMLSLGTICQKPRDKHNVRHSHMRFRRSKSKASEKWDFGYVFPHAENDGMMHFEEVSICGSKTCKMIVFFKKKRTILRINIVYLFNGVINATECQKLQVWK